MRASLRNGTTTPCSNRVAGLNHGMADVVKDLGILDTVTDKLHAGRITEGMNQLLPFLQSYRMHATELAWTQAQQQFLHHPLRALLHQDPFTLRAFTKPRGYAGDAPLLDFIYGREEGWPVPEGTSDLGRQIFEFTTASSSCDAVRARRGFIAHAIDNLAEENPQAHILSLAAGHLREALLCAVVKRRKFGRYVAFDADPESLREVRDCYGRFGIETMNGTIRQLVKQQQNLGGFDFVYSVGLFDYLPMSTARRLASAMFQMLRPRGRLLLANFLPGILDVGYMEVYMGWKLIYRTRLEMLEISREIPQEQVKDIHLFAEENQNIIFLEVKKR